MASGKPGWRSWGSPWEWGKGWGGWNAPVSVCFEKQTGPLQDPGVGKVSDPRGANEKAVGTPLQRYDLL